MHQIMLQVSCKSLISNWMNYFLLQPDREHEVIAQNCQALESQNPNEEHNIISEQSKSLIKETSKVTEEHKLISQQAEMLDIEEKYPVTY